MLRASRSEHLPTKLNCNYSALVQPAHFLALFYDKFLKNAQCTNQVHLRFFLIYRKKASNTNN